MTTRTRRTVVAAGLVVATALALGVLLRPAPSVEPPAGAASAQAAPSPLPPEPDADVIRPEGLGPGWRLAEPAEISPELAQEASGGPVSERDPGEVVTLMVPLGCVQRSTLPEPDRVIESTLLLADRGIPAVSLRLDFATSDLARTFVARRWQDVVACRDQPADPVSGAPSPVTSASVEESGLAVSTRTEPFLPPTQATWTEMFLQRGRTVTALAVNVAPTSPDLPDLDRVAATLSEESGQSTPEWARD